jgi:hypothetical protein
MSHFLDGEGQRGLTFARRIWQWLFGARKPRLATCTCGQPLPGLTKYGFSFLAQNVGDYLLGQCSGCRTIFWDSAVPLPAWLKEDVLR